MSQVTASPQQTFMSKALGIVGWIGGAAVGTYSGINLLIPLVATGAVWLVASKIMGEERKIILPAFSTNCGHFLWLTLGLALSGFSAMSALGVDLFVYMAGLSWLLVRPSLGPLYLLGIYQLISLGINTYSLAEAALGSAASKALLVHAIWRALTLFLVVKLFVSLRRTTRAIVDPVA